MTPKARVMAFLITEKSRPFCDGCLGRTLELSVGVVRWATLTLGSGFQRWFAQCSNCGKNRLVVAHAPVPSVHVA